MYRFIVASIVLLSFFINFTGSFDAGHINPDFTKDRTHAKITECALYKITYDYLQSNYDVSSSTPIEIDNGNCKNAKNTIKALIKSLKLNYQYYYLSIKDVMQSNRLVDIKEAFTTNAHFDDESFDKAAERIQSFKYTAITYANKEDFTLSRSYFGRMLHTLQDFYSHSNWVNFEPNKINQYLGSSLNLGSIAGKTVRTCEPCETSDCKNTIVKELLDKRILTSGYFSMFSSKKEVGKCSHGGFMDKTTSQDSKGRGINKDTNGAPQADLHLKAANLAFQSTYEVLKNFWASIGNQKFGNFLGFRGTSLAICIDTTGSMSPSIQSVKKTAIGLIDDSNAFNYILSPFNDPTWGPLTVTQDPVIFAQKINKLYAYGGGDTPELFYHGVLDAVRACEPNSVLYSFTDAPAKDEYLRPTTEMLAKDKNVKINPILIVGGFKNEDTKETETTMRANFLEDYESLAWATGGFTIFSSNSYVSGVSDLIVQQQTQENIQTLFVSSLDTTDSISASTTYKYEFVVDESVKTLYFYVSSSSTLPNQIRLLDPKDQLVTITNYTFNSPNTKSFYLNASSYGIWKIELSSASNPFSVKVTGLSEVEATTKLYEYKENIMHPSYFELSGNPKKLSQLVVTSSFENLKSKIKSGEFSIVLNNATVLTTLSGEVENDDEFSTVITNLTVPERDFRIKVRLELENGAIVERFEPFFFMPTTFNVNLGVNANQSSVIKINETFEFEFYVENVGSVLTASVDILITDSLELLDYKKRVTLPPNNNYNETVTLRIPNDVKYEGQTDLITVSVANVLTPTDTNYETIYVQIQSRNVTFDTIPQCVILSDEFSSSCNVNGKCSNLKYWNATLKVNDTGSGLSQINTIRNDQIGQEYTVNLTYDSFIYGSQQPLFVHVTADCCSQNFDIVVSDIYGNIGKCSFEKEANLAINLRLDSCNLFLVLFVSIFVWLKN